MDETAAAASVEEPKKTNKERLKEITDSIEAGIKDLFDSEKYKNYLRTMSKFHNYSFNNTIAHPYAEPGGNPRCQLQQLAG